MAEHLVFVSHSGADTWVARQLSHACLHTGATTFLDEADIAIGEDFERVILAALHKASELLVLITPWALGRTYIWLEIGVAWSRGIPISVVLHGMSVGELQTNTNFPVFIKQRNVIDINTVDRYFEELSARVKKQTSGHRDTMKIFLSYALLDREWVNELVGLLRTDGLEISDFGSSFDPGDDIGESLRQAIASADLVVAVITNRSIHNPNVLFEMGAAMGGKRPLLPLLVSPDGGAIQIPTGLAGLNFMRVGPPQEAAEEIRRRAAPRMAAA